MDTNVVTAIIALSGVILSVLLSFASSKRTLRIELEKVYRTIEQGYASRLFDKRIDAYLIIFQLLSDFVKFIRYDESEKLSLKEFLNKLNEYDSNHGILFSNDTGLKFHLLRKHIRFFVKNNKVIDELISDEKTGILEKIGAVEIALKNELGIFAVEYRNWEKKKTYSGYRDFDKEKLEKKYRDNLK